MVLIKQLCRPAVFAAVAVLAAVGSIWATPYWEDCTRLFRGKHVQISRTSLTSSEVRDAYYNFLIKNLDDFVDSLKRTGKLPRRKVSFGILEGWWYNNAPGYSVDMYRYKDGYYCWLSDISQDYLTKIITYFASDNWESFTYNQSKVDPNTALKNFNRRIDTITVTHKYPPRKAKDVNGDITVYFQDGELICKDANRVYGKIKEVFPFSIGSKTLISTEDTTYVVEDGAVVNQFKGTICHILHPFAVGSKMFITVCVEDLLTIYAIENRAVINKIKIKEEDLVSPYSSYDSPVDKEVFRGWVNIKGSEYVLSYSILKNKFYKVTQEREE
jgi:hypothetical protein